MNGERGRARQDGGAGDEHPRAFAGGETPSPPASDPDGFRLLESKLAPPRPLLPLVPRRAVVAALRESRAPLVVVCAPAGAGKTVVLLQWGEGDERLVTWVKLDEADNDPTVFLRYLAAALRRVAVIDPRVEQFLRQPVPPIDERVLPLLCRDIRNARPFVLVVDDASLLVNERCWDLLRSVLDNLPPGSQIALGTRTLPPLPVGRLKAEGRLIEIDTSQLAFDPAEAAALWSLQGLEADEQSLEALLAATEGWATGIYLASIMARDRPEGEWLSQVRGDHPEIAAYLTMEALREAPDDIQEFLCHTSILDEVTVPACWELTGREDAGTVLMELARRHLFVTPLDESGIAFRYHRLFVDLLRTELARREGGAIHALHARAARYYLAEGDLDRAFRHFQQAGQMSEAAALVTSQWPRLWDMGQQETVRRWLDSFTDAQILSDPALTLTAGWVKSAFGSSSDTERWALAACSVRVEDLPAPFGAVSLRSSQALLRATLALDGVTQMRECAELAVALETRAGSSWYAEARITLGTARWLSGSPRQAVRPLQIAAREGLAFNPSAELAALATLSLIAADEEDWRLAEEYSERAGRRLREAGFRSNRRSLLVLLAEARVRIHRGELVQDLLARITEVLGTMVPHPWMAVVACVLLGEMSLEAGDRSAAMRWSGRATAELKRYPDAGVFKGRADRLRKALELEQLAEPLTKAEHALLDLLPTHLTEAQMAERLFVSPNTVKSHLHAIYRKLGVNSRADAVQRAHDAGLLRAPDGG